MPTTLHGCRPRRAATLLTVLVVLPPPLAAAGCGSDRSLPACGGAPAHVVALGGADDGGYRGNGRPAVVTAPVGEVFAVSAQFGQRTLSAPSTTSPAVRRICASGRGPARSEFVAVAPGTADISAETIECGPCAGFLFQVEVIVTDGSPSITPGSRGASATGSGDAASTASSTRSAGSARG